MNNIEKMLNNINRISDDIISGIFVIRVTEESTAKTGNIIQKKSSYFLQKC